MRILTVLILTISLSTLLVSCNSRSQAMSQDAQSAMMTQEFTFKADRALVEYYSVDYVTNNLNAPPLVREQSSRNVVNLTPGYTIDFKENELIVYLPYLNRILKTSLRNEDASQFSITNFSLKKRESKKGNTIYTIVPADKKLITEITVELGANGRATVEVNAKKNQSVIYEGSVGSDFAQN